MINKFLVPGYFVYNFPKIICNMSPANISGTSLLSQNLKESQGLISFLKREIKELTLLAQEKQEAIKIKKLLEENKNLQKEIDEVKNKLVELQVGNGIKQIPIPGDEAKEKNQPITLPNVKTSEKVLSKESNNVSSAKNTTSNLENKPTKTPKQKKVAAPAADEPPVDVGRLDIRVGQIVSAKVHPDADQLYLEQINVGEENPRTVISGLVKHIPLAELDQKIVLVLCNLKPQKMRGIMSEAMVLCASTPEKVELLCPPPDAVAGDKVAVPGYPRNPDLPFLNPKKKIFEQVAEDLKVDSDKRASYKGVPWEVEGKPGVITAKTLTGCHIK